MRRGHSNMTIIQRKSKFKTIRDFNKEDTTETSASLEPPEQVEDYGAQYHCDTCQIDITHSVRIKCAECSDFDLCVDCFAGGTSVKNHLPSHNYRVMDVLDFPLFEEGWGADEELLMVEGLESFGIGNWEQISDHITTKTKDECAAHYQRVYIESPSWPLPDKAKIFDLETTRRSRQLIPQDTKKTIVKIVRPPSSAPSNHEIAGYMPARGEFDVEYENDAESHVGPMIFEEGESEDDVLLKTTVLDIYNKVLDRRLDRKKLIFSRNLTDFKKIQAQEKKRTKDSRDEKEIMQKIRPFARMQTAADFELFSQELIEEQQLRQKVALFQEYRRMGLTELKDIAKYEKDKKEWTIGMKNSGHRESYTTAHTERNVSSRYSSSSLANTKFKLESRAGTPKSSANSPIPGTNGGSGQGDFDAMQIDSANNGIRRPPLPLNISSSEGHDLLSQAEQELCSKLRILPRAYLVIKETLLSEYQKRNGNLKKRAARGLVKIDVNKTSKVWDFFVGRGWIS